jgi:general secretion pathway protein G
MTKQQSMAGFTLIEIMVVIVILGVLGALVIPNIIGRTGAARVTAAKSDIRAIGNALNLYKLDNFSFPSTDQGLQALVEKPTGLPEPKNWNVEGYLDKVPKDPWGNPYQYISPGQHGHYDLSTMGSDGAPGGDGDAADINSWEL